MKKQLIICLLLFTSSMLLYSQSEEKHKKESESENPVLEIITSGIYVTSFKNKENTFGTELHLTYWFNHKWGGGLSYTAKFEEEETLNDVALLGSWNPTKWITLNVGPNFGLSGEHRDFEVSAYTEAEINIRPKEWIHFGPVIGTVLGRNSEFTLGMHLGFEF
ncbi:MAG: hypothetical protein V7719_06005 [Psychroserpens sp.]|uniref:hypothetical protein n=1 Tax=Psychroserpens sp. TaxID=2020870 RepID=UPI003001D473